MKIISTSLIALGLGAFLMGAAVSPVAPAAAPTTAFQEPLNEATGAIKIIIPQKDLESAIRSSEKGDILLYTSEGWYRIEGKTLKQGTKMYVLGNHGSMVSVFPKEAEHTR